MRLACCAAVHLLLLQSICACSSEPGVWTVEGRIPARIQADTGYWSISVQMCMLADTYTHDAVDRRLTCAPLHLASCSRAVHYVNRCFVGSTWCMAHLVTPRETPVKRFANPIGFASSEAHYACAALHAMPPRGVCSLVIACFLHLFSHEFIFLSWLLCQIPGQQAFNCYSRGAYSIYACFLCLSYMSSLPHCSLLVQLALSSPGNSAAINSCRESIPHLSRRRL